MARRVKLLLVEDEQTLAAIVADTLNDRGFEVRVAQDGAAGLEMFRQERPDVVVTDIMMPRVDGFTMVERLRASGERVPVLMLSARGAAEDVVRGFETGAGDYLRKPFAIAELVVRINALLGRSEAAPTTYNIGSLEFDASLATLSGVELSAREAEVLARLAAREGEIVPLRTLLMDVWGDDSYFAARSLHVFITRLRRRLAADPRVAIVNARGVGYKLTVKR